MSYNSIENVFYVVVAQNKGFEQFTQRLTHHHLKKIARKIMDYFFYIDLNHHLPSLDASASDCFCRTRGVVLATPTEREREGERFDSLLGWHTATPRPPQTIYDGRATHPKPWGGRRATLDPNMGWLRSPP